LARPKGLEPPTTWFEDTPASLRLQLKQSLAKFAALANLT